MPNDEQVIRIEREDDEALIIGEPLALAVAFFTGDPSSVGEDSFDQLAGGGDASKIVLEDVRTVNRTMRARSPHKYWTAIIDGQFEWLTAIPEDLDLLELHDDEWAATNGNGLLDAAVDAVLGKGRGLAVGTKVLHLKRPRLFPVLDRFVAEMFGVNMPSAPTPQQRRAIGQQLVRAVRREGRRNIEVLGWVQQKLHDEANIDRPLVRILDGLVWFSHPAAGVPGAKRTLESGVKTVVWTDGSCNANGMHGRGGWAARIEQAGTVREIFDSAHGTTHNRMELTAICEALETLTGAIEVRTDSTYVEKCFNQNWHERWLRDGSWKGSNGPIKNRDLWERLFGLKWDGRRDVTFVWIRGHAGDPNNHRVDRLARAAALSAG